MTALALLAVLAVALLLTACALLMREGVRNGDRPSDARVIARLVLHEGPDAAEIQALVTVANPGAGVVLATGRAERAPRLLRLVAFDRGTRTAHLHARSLRDRVLLGAVPPGSTRTWCLPAEVGSAGLLRIRVWLDQAPPRTRIATFLLETPRLFPRGAATAVALARRSAARG